MAAPTLVSQLVPVNGASQQEPLPARHTSPHPAILAGGLQSRALPSGACPGPCRHDQSARREGTASSLKASAQPRGPAPEWGRHLRPNPEQGSSWRKGRRECLVPETTATHGCLPRIQPGWGPLSHREAPALAPTLHLVANSSPEARVREPSPFRPGAHVWDLGVGP